MVVKEKMKSVDGTSCPGCSGEVMGMGGYPNVGVCMSCDGIVGNFGSLADSEKFVSFTKPMSDADEGSKYFDFSYDFANGMKDRVHGWYDPKSKAVTQYG